MKTYRILNTVLIGALLAAACANLEEIESRVSTLEEKVAGLDKLCNSLNSSISAMDGIVSVLQGSETITAIDEIKEDGVVVGYAITFSKSGVKKIYNGAAGADGINGINGINGTNGITPELKIEDGCWWVRYGDSEWKNVGQATGSPGAPGAPGTPGIPGTPGQTPEFKIEGGCWWIRFGEGEWVNYGQATGDPGRDGEPAPVIGIVPGADGAYYWTLGGEVMLDNAGQPFAAGGQNGITPELKIEDGFWWVKYGSGEWVKYGKATGDNGAAGTPGKDGTVWKLGDNGNWWADSGEGFKDTGVSYKGEKGDTGDSMFTSVTSDGSSLTLVLAGDGGTIVVPVSSDLSIAFATSGSIPATPGATVKISYTISAATGSADIDVLPTSGLKAKVEEDGLQGIITVVLGATVDFEYDKVTVIVTNGSKTLLKKITFSESGSIVVTDEHTSSLMTCKGGTVNFNIAANVEYSVSITSGGSPAGWVHHKGTKAMTPYCLEFQVDANAGAARTATITISGSETSDTAEFTVIQYAYTPSFVVTGSAAEAIIPTMTGTGLSGLVDFDGEIVEWSPSLTHTWPDEAAHSAEYFVEGAAGFSLGELTNLVKLDVSGF